MRQERTSGQGDLPGSANPTRSKAEQGRGAARPGATGALPGWAAQMDGHRAGVPAYRTPPIGRLAPSQAAQGRGVIKRPSPQSRSLPKQGPGSPFPYPPPPGRPAGK